MGADTQPKFLPAAALQQNSVVGHPLLLQNPGSAGPGPQAAAFRFLQEVLSALALSLLFSQHPLAEGVDPLGCGQPALMKDGFEDGAMEQDAVGVCEGK